MVAVVLGLGDHMRLHLITHVAGKLAELDLWAKENIGRRMSKEEILKEFGTAGLKYLLKSGLLEKRQDIYVVVEA